MSEWKRKKRHMLAFGVTSIANAHTNVLLCALASVEIRSLKIVVKRSDANATIHVSAANEIWGKPSR